jgi:hypothetical protein
MTNPKFSVCDLMHCADRLALGHLFRNKCPNAKLVLD